MIREGIDVPRIVGEFYAGDEGALQKLEDWRAKGFAGGYAWSLFWDSTADKLQVDWAAATTFGNKYDDIGPRVTTSPPSSGCALSPDDVDYCRDCGPCEIGEGDCDPGNNECVAGAECIDISGIDHCTAIVPPPSDFCGDNACTGAETCETCSVDCGTCPVTPPRT